VSRARAAVVSRIAEPAFVEARRKDWDEFDRLATKLRLSGPKKLAPAELARLGPLHRDVCGDLAHAQSARYSAPLIEHLRVLTADGHAALYGLRPRGGGLRGALLRGPNGGLLAVFPRAVRRHWRAMALSAGLFFVPLIVTALLVVRDPAFAFRIVPESMLGPLVDSYAQGFSDGRSADEGAFMAGFYVNNNVGIALRCFALGIFGGVGSAFYLFFNGLAIGAIFGYVVARGAGANILTFVVGHGSLELGAIVLAGGAGLALGWSLVAPGDKTRLASLQAIGRDVVAIVGGAAVMLIMAAAIEGFWSGSSVDATIKRVLGGALFVLVLAYLVLVGRGATPAGALAPPPREEG
jgi:uncharacterized membrane protein SpoIIM required for sporulation